MSEEDDLQKIVLTIKTDEDLVKRIAVFLYSVVNGGISNSIDYFSGLIRRLLTDGEVKLGEEMSMLEKSLFNLIMSTLTIETVIECVMRDDISVESRNNIDKMMEFFEMKMRSVINVTNNYISMNDTEQAANFLKNRGEDIRKLVLDFLKKEREKEKNKDK
mgnify:CR=1 FL=1